MFFYPGREYPRKKIKLTVGNIENGLYDNRLDQTELWCCEKIEVIPIPLITPDGTEIKWTMSDIKSTAYCNLSK